MGDKQKGKKNHIIDAVIMLSIGITFLLILVGVFGSSGKVVSDFIVGSVGYAAYGYCVGLILFAILKLCRFMPRLNLVKTLCITLAVVMFLALLHVISSSRFVVEGTTYKAYLIDCYKNPVTAGGILGGVFLYPILKLNYVFAVVLTALITVGAIGAVIFTQFDTKKITKFTKRSKNPELTDLNNIGGGQTMNEVGGDMYVFNKDREFKSRGSRTDMEYVPLDELNRENHRQTIAKGVLEGIPGAEEDYEKKHKSAINILFGGDNEPDAYKGVAEAENNEDKAIRRNRLIDKFAKHKEVEKGENNILGVDLDKIISTDEPKNNSGGKDYFNVENIVVDKKETFNAPQNSEFDSGYKPLIDNVLKSNSTNIDDIWSQRSKEKKIRGNELPSGADNRKNYFDSIEKLNTAASDFNKDSDKINRDKPSNFSSAIESLNGKISKADLNDDFDFSSEKPDIKPPESDTYFAADEENKIFGNKSVSTAADDDWAKDLWNDKTVNNSGKAIENGELFGNSINVDSGNNAENYEADAPDIYAEEVMAESVTEDKEDYYFTEPKSTADDYKKGGANKSKTDYKYESMKPKESKVDNVKNSGNFVIGRMDDGGGVSIVKAPYKYPPTSLLLNHDEKKAKFGDLQEKIDVLENTLSTFKIDAKVVNTVQGPTFTRFELQMPPGISVNRVKQYENDIAMSLAASSIRCQIPIPNKNAFGVEIPNETVGTVGMRKIIESAEFQYNKQMLSVVLGQDCDGKNYVVDLVSLNHVLIAGSTGSGKSVCLNTLICSLLYKYTPEDVRLILVDPKQVEFKDYAGIPHLLAPEILITDKHCINAMDWLIAEMERRFEMIKNVPGAKNQMDYNERLQPGMEKMPFIVAIIDEVGDIMIRSKKEFEERAVTLTQKSRAAGIIVVLATQRPTVDVILGTIKANLPSRIAFAVLSYQDSKTILDQAGAETLLGKGDMLFIRRGSSIMQRIQGAFISSDEATDVSNYVKDNNESHYDEEIVRQFMIGKPTAEAPPQMTSEQERDERNEKLLAEASIYCAESSYATASMLQRKFNIGYNRAATLIETMEALGYVSRDSDNAKRRRILVSKEELMRRYNLKNDD